MQICIAYSFYLKYSIFFQSKTFELLKFGNKMNCAVKKIYGCDVIPQEYKSFQNNTKGHWTYWTYVYKHINICL